MMYIEFSSLHVLLKSQDALLLNSSWLFHLEFKKRKKKTLHKIAIRNESEDICLLPVFISPKRKWVSKVKLQQLKKKKKNESFRSQHPFLSYSLEIVYVTRFFASLQKESSRYSALYPLYP